MTTKHTGKNYGPVEWPQDLLDKLYRCPVDNNDEQATEDLVRGWSKNFASHAEAFRQSHLGLIKGETK